MANQVTFQIKIETLGALRRFKLETGEDAEHVSSASDIAVLIWCCCKTCEKSAEERAAERRHYEEVKKARGLS